MGEASTAVQRRESGVEETEPGPERLLPWGFGVWRARDLRGKGGHIA